MVQGRVFLLAALFAASAAIAAEPTVKGPIPEDKVPVPASRPDAAPGTPPIPQEKPEEKPGAKPNSPAAGTQPEPPAEGKSSQPPTPPPPAEPSTPDSNVPAAPSEAKAEPPEKEDMEAYAACLADLKEAGVEFSETTPIDDGNGCGMDKPLIVRTVLPDIRLQPEATMRCQTALALSRWAKASVLPAAAIAYGPNAPRITAFNQATSYACRNRNSAEAGKISEHAHGNAIDIAGFTFSDGKTFVIEPREKDSTLVGAFERAITASACLFFTTVLGPASDAAHETHLHLDVMKRKGDYRYCW